MSPGGRTERAVVIAMAILIAGELAVFAEGSVMEIISIAIEAILGKIFVID